MAVYKSTAEEYLRTLQKFERAPTDYQFVKQFEEDSSFWRLFNLDARPKKDYDLIAEWNPIFLDVNVIILLDNAIAC